MIEEKQRQPRKDRGSYSAGSQKGWTRQRRAKLAQKVEERKANRTKLKGIAERMGKLAAARMQRNWEAVQDKAQAEPLPVRGSRQVEGLTLEKLVKNMGARDG